MKKKYLLAIREKDRNEVFEFDDKHERAMALDNRARRKGKFTYAISER